MVTAPDYETIQLMATASVAAWAASQKDGIRQEDAVLLAGVLRTIEDFHSDGTPVTLTQFTPVVMKELPKRYQPLVLVIVALIENELGKRGLSTEIPVAGSVSQKIVQAIVDGAMFGLSPYLPTSHALVPSFTEGNLTA